MSFHGIKVRVHFEVDGIRGSEEMIIYGHGESYAIFEAFWHWQNRFQKMLAEGTISTSQVLEAVIV